MLCCCCLVAVLILKRYLGTCATRDTPAVVAYRHDRLCTLQTALRLVLCCAPSVYQENLTFPAAGPAKTVITANIAVNLAIVPCNNPSGRVMACRDRAGSAATSDAAAPLPQPPDCCCCCAAVSWYSFPDRFDSTPSGAPMSARSTRLPSSCACGRVLLRRRHVQAPAQSPHPTRPNINREVEEPESLRNKYETL